MSNKSKYTSDPSMALLTQTEVAGRLGYSVIKVKRLRRAGLLPYVPGRPVLILAKDVQDYIERERPDLNERSDEGVRLLDAIEVGRRLNRRPLRIRTFLEREEIPFYKKPKIVVKEQDLWDYLIRTGHIRRSAFGEEPLGPAGEAAFRGAIDRVLHERIAQLDYDDDLRERRLHASLKGAAARTVQRKKAREEKERRKQKQSERRRLGP
jgi:hypothetical protein